MSVDLKSELYDMNAKLCRAVQKYPCIYDRDHMSYLKKEPYDAAWEAISKLCEDSVASCKVRWRNIRTAFIRSIQGTPKKRTPNRTREYYLFDVLEFFIPHITNTMESEKSHDSDAEMDATKKIALTSNLKEECESQTSEGNGATGKAEGDVGGIAAASKVIKNETPIKDDTETTISADENGASTDNYTGDVGVGDAGGGGGGGGGGGDTTTIVRTEPFSMTPIPTYFIKKKTSKVGTFIIKKSTDNKDILDVDKVTADDTGEDKTIVSDDKTSIEPISEQKHDVHTMDVQMDDMEAHNVATTSANINNDVLPAVASTTTESLSTSVNSDDDEKRSFRFRRACKRSLDKSMVKELRLRKRVVYPDPRRQRRSTDRLRSISKCLEDSEVRKSLLQNHTQPMHVNKQQTTTAEGQTIEMKAQLLEKINQNAITSTTTAVPPPQTVTAGAAATSADATPSLRENKQMIYPSEVVETQMRMSPVRESNTSNIEAVPRDQQHWFKQLNDDHLGIAQSTPITKFSQPIQPIQSSIQPMQSLMQPIQSSMQPIESSIQPIQSFIQPIQPSMQFRQPPPAVVKENPSSAPPPSPSLSSHSIERTQHIPIDIRDQAVQCNFKSSTDLNDDFLISLRPQMAQMNTRQLLNFKQKIYQALVEVFDDPANFPATQGSLATTPINPSSQTQSSTLENVSPDEMRLMRELVSSVQSAKLQISETTVSPQSSSASNIIVNQIDSMDTNENSESPCEIIDMGGSGGKITGKIYRISESGQLSECGGSSPSSLVGRSMPHRLIRKIVKVGGGDSGSGGVIAHRNGGSVGELRRVFRLYPKRNIIPQNSDDGGNIGTLIIPRKSNHNGSAPITSTLTTATATSISSLAGQKIRLPTNSATTKTTTMMTAPTTVSAVASNSLDCSKASLSRKVAISKVQKRNYIPPTISSRRVLRRYSICGPGPINDASVRRTSTEVITTAANTSSTSLLNASSSSSSSSSRLYNFFDSADIANPMDDVFKIPTSRSSFVPASGALATADLNSTANDGTIKRPATNISTACSNRLVPGQIFKPVSDNSNNKQRRIFPPLRPIIPSAIYSADSLKIASSSPSVSPSPSLSSSSSVTEEQKITVKGLLKPKTTLSEKYKATLLAESEMNGDISHRQSSSAANAETAGIIVSDKFAGLNIKSEPIDDNFG